MELGPHDALTRNVEELLGRFVDVSWAYRFGPPAQDLIAISLHDPVGELLSQAFRFPAGRPLARESASGLGLQAVIDHTPTGAVLRVTSRRFAYGVRVAVPGYAPSDDAFGVEPGQSRTIALRPVVATARFAEPAALTALNLDGALEVAVPASAQPEAGSVSSPHTAR